MKKALFPKVGGILHGGDYNPEQWLDRPDILEEDIRLMKQAGMNSVTLGVFSWSTYEPEEGEYHFEWLKEIMDKLYDNGIYTVLATPSGARPAWLDQKYPEAMRVDARGVRAHHGGRHNHCMSSPVYREKVKNMIRRLCDCVGSHPGLILWHISNEFGGACFCPLCVARFQGYLAEKFDHDIEKLNHAWWTTFWSHNYNDFSQIEPPYENGEQSIMGLNMEWHRFTTWNMTDYMKEEIRLVRQLTPGIPVTTNFMELYYDLDYRVMAKELDLVSWDSYPYMHNDYETLGNTMAKNAFSHALVRGMKKDAPFLLMESAPGAVNWQAYNKQKRPGIHRLFSLHAVGCGSDSVQYFQWRKGRGAFEQHHGAVVDHLGRSDTRIFREVQALGKELPCIAQTAGTLVKTQAALLFDWDNWWAIREMKGLGQESKQYPETCLEVYKSFLKMGVDMDVISSDDELSGYRVLVAPMLYMLHTGTAARLKKFVMDGGQLLATYLTGYVDQNQLCYLGGFPGEGLSELFGVVSEEIDTLYPSDRNRVVFVDGTRAEVRDYVEVLRTDLSGKNTDGVSQQPEILARYEEDYYAGLPAVTKKRFGKGQAWYVGARISQDKMRELFADMLETVGISTLSLPDGVELHQRTDGLETFTFCFNHTKSKQNLEGVYGRDLLSGKEITSGLELEEYGVSILQSSVSQQDK